jgi:hypothetical protein
MQPYLFPYLGYFQLISAVDVFVVYDDVNYIKGGWVNRNFILGKQGKQLITLPLQGASPNRLINEIHIQTSLEKILNTIRHSYRKAPYYYSVFPLIENILMQPENNLARFLDYQLRKICEYLDISPDWYLSSSLKKNNLLRGQDKILAICNELHASHYINATGGKLLYDKNFFLTQGVKLSFIQSNLLPYPQYGKDFLPNLSIIDVMMFNNKDQSKKMVKGFRLV